MKIALKTLISAALFVSGGSAMADTFTVCDVRVGFEANTNLVMIRSCETRVSQVGCPGTGWVYWQVSDPYSKEMLSLATTALIAGKQVLVGYKGANICTGGHDWANMINLKK